MDPGSLGSHQARVAKLKDKPCGIKMVTHPSQPLEKLKLCPHLFGKLTSREIKRGRSVEAYPCLLVEPQSALHNWSPPSQLDQQIAQGGERPGWVRKDTR